YASRPGRPVPPPGTPVPPPGTLPSAPPMLHVPVKVTPTTLGASNGQVAARSAAPPATRSRLGWVIAGVLVLGGAGAAIALVATRGDDRHAAAGRQDAGLIAAPAAADAAQPAIALDAGAVAATTPDAGVVPDAAPAMDAALPPPPPPPP